MIFQLNIISLNMHLTRRISLLAYFIFINLTLLVHYSNSVPVVINKIDLNSYPGLNFARKIRDRSLSATSLPEVNLQNNRYIENIHLNYLLRRQVVQNRTQGVLRQYEAVAQVRQPNELDSNLATSPHHLRNRIHGVLTLNSKRNVSSQFRQQVSHAMERIREILGAKLSPVDQGMSERQTELLSHLENGILDILERGMSLNGTRTRSVPVVSDKKAGKLFRLKRSASIEDGGEDNGVGPRKKRFSGYKMFLDKTDKTSMLCPYTIEKDVNENRFPKTINRIKCKFENCLCSNKGSFRCTQLWTKYEVQFSGSTGTDEVDVEHSCVCATSQSLGAADLEGPSNLVS